MVTVVAVLAVAVAAGAVIQGSIGFGYALVAVPAMVLLLPWAVPVTPLFLALPMTLLMSAREWRSIDLGGFALITGAACSARSPASCSWSWRRRTTSRCSRGY